MWLGFSRRFYPAVNLVYLLRILAFSLCGALFIGVLVIPSQAEQKQAVTANPPTTAFSGLSIFKRGFDSKGVVEVIDLNQNPSHQQQAPKDVPQKPEQDTAQKQELSYVGEDKVLPPDQTPRTRVNKDAPAPIKAMVSSLHHGDKVMAKEYAGQYVRYLQKYFFDVREIVSLLGEAMIDEKLIDEEQWVGVGQSMSYELAKTRLATGAIIKPTHESALARITPDSKNTVKVFYFFGLNCSWCRYMAPDVERLWQLAKKDPRIEMTGLLIGESPQEWLTEYRRYTDLSLPIFDGTALARDMNIGFVPALVVVTETDQRAYIKSGQQNFERMYEFVRTAQGLPATVTPEFKRLASLPVGQVERQHAQARLGKTPLRVNHTATQKPKRVRVTLERF